MLKEEIIKQKRLTIDNKDIYCFSHENIFASLMSIQSYILDIIAKEEIKSFLDPFVFNKLIEINVSILGIINYALHYLDKVKYSGALLQEYDRKIKKGNISKKECYSLEKSADGYEYSFYLAKDNVTNASEWLNDIIPDINILFDSISNYISNYLSNGEYDRLSLDDISNLISSSHKKVINIFIDKLLVQSNGANYALDELDLMPKSRSGQSCNDALALNRKIVTFIFLPIILNSKLFYRKQADFKKVFRELLGFSKKLLKIEGIDSNASNLLYNLFGLIGSYFFSGQANGELYNLRDDAIANFCLENMRGINLKNQGFFDKKISKFRERAGNLAENKN